MSNGKNSNLAIKEPSLSVERIKELVGELGSEGFFVLVDGAFATLEYPVEDESHPDGGYLEGMPLADGQSYAIVPLVGKVDLPQGVHSFEVGK